MKKYFLITALVLGIAQAGFSAGMGGLNSGFNPGSMPQIQQNPFYDMQQLQNQYREKEHSMNEFQSFEEQKKANQERIKQENERREYLEEKAVRTKTNKQFVNDNGIIKIENMD